MAETYDGLVDFLRGVSMSLFVVVVVQVGYIFKKYFAVLKIEILISDRPRSGLLPVHVIILGVSLIGFATMCVTQNFVRMGEPATYFTYLNPVFLALTANGLHLVMLFEYRRYKEVEDNLL